MNFCYFFWYNVVDRLVVFDVEVKFTLDWLQDHINTKLSVAEISEKLTNIGIEVENVCDESLRFKNFVVGFVKSATKHPNADSLQICEVDVGDEVLQIVCGASNARAGIFVVVALVGAVVPCSGEKIKNVKVRGVESHGMLCSAQELLVDLDGVLDCHDGIIELSKEHVAGTSVAKALGFDEIVFDVSITPNRADCLSVAGIARELAMFGCGEFVPLKFDLPKAVFENPIETEILTADCLYFSTCALKNAVFATPFYIAKRLRAIGQKLIFGAVDVANYVCFDIGQPLHIFDLEKLEKNILVKNSDREENIQALDNKKYAIPKGAVVISSKNEVLSVAGVIGGVNSACFDGTKDILIEAACYDKVAIAKVGQKLRLQTEARTRFEKGIDPNNVDVAMQYFVSLVVKNSCCEVSSVKRYKNPPQNVNTIRLTYHKFNALSGFGQKFFDDAVTILQNFGCSIVAKTNTSIDLQTPSFRHDLLIEEDVIEELLRAFGYENIAEKELEKREPVTQVYKNNKLSDAMMYNNYYEIKTFSFTDQKTAKLFATEDQLVSIKDPLTIDFSVLRPSVVALHLAALLDRQNKSQKNARVFEIGKKFTKKNGTIVEEQMLTATISEKNVDREWRRDKQDVSIFDIKEDLERILSLFVKSSRILNDAPSYYHPGRSGAYVLQENTVVAYFGELHPTILSEFGLGGPVVCFELFLDRLPEFCANAWSERIVLSPYQPVVRDFSFVVDKKIPAAAIVASVNNLEIKEIKNVLVFDVYEAEMFGSGKKAVTIEVVIQSDFETLSEQKISDISEKITSGIWNDCSGVLRKIAECPADLMKNDAKKN